MMHYLTSKCTEDFLLQIEHVKYAKKTVYKIIKFLK